MSRLLLLGCCPLPGEPGRVATGPGLRAWQFLKPLRAAGHDVRFMALRNERDYRHDVPPVVRHRLGDGFSYEALSVAFFSDARLLIARQDAWRPDGVLGVGSVLPAQMAVLAAAEARCPAWADLFGDALAELQARAFADDCAGDARGADRDRAHVGFMMLRILARADRVSAVSRRQEEAVLGQLGLVGRLNRHTVGELLTCVIPCGVDLEPVPSTLSTSSTSSTDFTVLLGGSFNTWMDVETLSTGLELAMRGSERIRVAVTGGPTPGYGERLFGSFVARMKSAGLLDRVALHGWVPNEAVAAIHARCDVGLNVDRWSVEGLLGSRNRVIQWLHLGLPVITTPLTEVTADLAAAGGVVAFPVGDAAALADALLAAARDPAPLRATLAAGRAFVRREYNLAQTLGTALAWAAAPAFAADWVAVGAVRASAGAPVSLNSLHASFLAV